VTRDELVQVYGAGVRQVPDGARIVEWEFPDGSGSWGWCHQAELFDMVFDYRRRGCGVWIDGDYYSGGQI
jgi:hypothetical protein